MKITDEMVEYIANLSRLQVRADQVEPIRAGLDDILAYMDRLAEVDTTGVEPMSHTFPVKNVLREDMVQPSAPREELLAGAPKTDGEGFLVPKTVE